ncbi:MAG: Gfo/Idh/MocA family oxidoreductase [Nitrososphaerales archaeon]
MKYLGVGLVGVGSIGSVHAENLGEKLPRASLLAISDVNMELANQIAGKLGVNKVYSDYQELLENKSVEALVLAIPTFLKHKMIIQAARAGKHVFVEKPLALSLEEADAIIEVCRKADVKLQVGYQRRFDHAYAKVERSIASGEIGQILIVRSWTRDPPANPQGWSIDPKLSGGIWLDTCSHDFDTVCFLTKAKVVSVYAKGANLVYDQLEPYGGFDNVLVTLELSNGALAQIDSCGYSVYGYDAGAEVLGTLGAAFVGMGRNSSADIVNKTSITRDLPRTYQERFAQAYHDELEDFVNCVLENREPRVTGKHGRDAVQIGLAASQSIEVKGPAYL